MSQKLCYILQLILGGKTKSGAGRQRPEPMAPDMVWVSDLRFTISTLFTNSCSMFGFQISGWEDAEHGGETSISTLLTLTPNPKLQALPPM